MTHPVHAPPAAAESARQRAARAEAIKDAWRDGQQTPDAAAALREDPDIAADRAAALDLAYEEFCTREEAGELLDSAAFCARFSFGASLRRLITLHRFLDEHPDALGGVPNWPAPGEAVGDFLLLRELGRGGFSRVYLALETTAGDRPVALKVSAVGSREAATLGPLSHPHLIPVLSSRAVENWTAVAMPFFGTATLDDVLSAWKSGRTGSPRSAGVILEAAAQGSRTEDPDFLARHEFPLRAGMSYEDGVAVVASRLFAAVAFLHSRGVAHRDLKPSNVLLGPTGHPYLLDFNLASRVGDPWRLAGTLPYMAPEQLLLLADERAATPDDWRPADVFSCGVILFELLTGEHPFGDPSEHANNPNRAHVAAELLRVQRAGHPALAAMNPRLRRAVAVAVERCLSLNPAARPTAAELAELFERAASPRRRWPWFAAALASVGLALAIALASPWNSTRAPEAPTPPQSPAAHVPTPAPPPAPTDPFARGVLLYRQGQYVLAVGEFLSAAKVRNDGKAYACAAYCTCLGGDPRQAEQLADLAIEFGERTPATYANRAYIRQRWNPKLLRAAKEDCDQALHLDRNLRAARLTRAFIALRLQAPRRDAKLLNEAIADIEFVTAGTPNTLDVWMTAAQLYVHASVDQPAMLDKAAQAVQEAVLVGKDPGTIRRNTTLNRALAGHPIYEKALTLTPGKNDPAVNLHLVSPIPDPAP